MEGIKHSILIDRFRCFSSNNDSNRENENAVTTMEEPEKKEETRGDEIGSDKASTSVSSRVLQFYFLLIIL